MITRETDYALRAILFLSRQEMESTISTAQLSEAMDIPYRFLRKIVAKLVSAGLVRSRRGKGGGLGLARPATEITLLSVVKATDPNVINLNECLISPSRCSRAKGCVLHDELSRIQDTLTKNLAEVDFGELVSRES